MKSKIAIVLLMLPLAACSSKAVFYTSTDFGINADMPTGRLEIGLDTSAGFLGPAYPESGAVPPVIGVVEANLKVLNPKVRQLYATGLAAELSAETVVRYRDQEKADEAFERRFGDLQKPTMSGDRRPMFFGTSDTYGLKISFVGPTPSGLNIGYSRKEMSVIPLQADDPNDGIDDKYASVFASVRRGVEVKELSNSGLESMQFFATGKVAELLALDPTITGNFLERAKAPLPKYTVTAEDEATKD